jgi:hypothetical protein
MEEPEQPKRPAKRKEPIKLSDAKNKTVTVSEGAFIQVEQSAKKLRMSKSKYTSAAIDYFATNGLDPTKAGVSELAQLRTLVGETTYEIRKQNVDIGNRLVAILRTWEANQYKFMQAQQGSVLGYLESIEVNILNHQVALESQLLTPLLERVVRNGVDSHLARMIGEVLILKTKGTSYSQDELRQSTSDYDAQRDRQLVNEIRKLLDSATITAPKPTVKPILAVPIVGAPAKAAPASGATTATTTPISPKP